MQNSFGAKFRFTTFGESHGIALGVIVDGVPAGLEIDEDFIQAMEYGMPCQSGWAVGFDRIISLLT